LFVVCWLLKCIAIKVCYATSSVSVLTFVREQLLLPRKSGIEILVLPLSLQHSADTRQIWRLSAPPKSCSRYQSIIIVITTMLIIIYAVRTNKMHIFSVNDSIQLYCLRHVSNIQLFILRKTKSGFCACAITFKARSTMSTGSFPGVKRPGRVAGHSPHSSAEVANVLERCHRLPFVSA
jgi:hypothetical protein